MPKIVNPDNERKNILTAFEHCLLSKPINSVTVRDIAKEAGISHAKIFFYFNNKEEIIMAYAKHIAQVYCQGFEGITAKAFQNTHSKIELLKNLILELYSLDKNNIVEKAYAQIYILGQYSEEMRKIILEAYAGWRESIKVMLAHFDPHATDSEARSILVLVEGILIYRMNDALPQQDALRIPEDLFS